MRRTIRILGYGATVVSLLLCVASGGMWVRSYRVRDGALWLPAGRADRAYAYYSGSGHLILRRLVTNLPVRIEQVLWDTIPVGELPQAVYRGWDDDDAWHGFA